MFSFLKKKLAVRVRFAPSPTGSLHVGGLRVALYNYLFARQHGGKFILRIEDTDRTRFVPSAQQEIIDVLSWAGLTPDEGPIVQSERLAIYRQHAEQLLASGQAYRCYCSPERLETMRQEQIAAKQPPMYDRRCLGVTSDSSQPHVIRLKVPRDKTTTFNDLIRGTITIANATIDDQVLLKADGFPTYHLAAVVDDHLMNISHVLRGEEWLTSTPKHILIYQAFGWTAPQFAHLPNILNSDKKKLSKRQGDVAAVDYIKQGYLPAALLNFIALLGWHPTDGQKEILSLAELQKEFSLDRVQKAGAVFDHDKLDWLNHHYIQQLPLAALVATCQPYLPAGAKDTTPVIALFRERLHKLSDITELSAYFFNEPTIDDSSLLVWKKSTASATKNNLEKLMAFLEKQSDWTVAGLEQGIEQWLTDQQLGKGDVLWPMRFALTGRDKSPTPFEVASVLGKEKTIQRLHHAVELFS